MKTVIELAVEGLITALDNTPRVNWPQAAMMALQSVKDAGYAEGYRVGSFDLKKTQEEPVTVAETVAATASGHAMPTMHQGEDKTLSNDKPSPEEALEDLGHEFIRQIAYQLGVLATKHDLTPGSVDLGVEITDNPDGFGKRARLSINLKNPTP